MCIFISMCVCVCINFHLFCMYVEISPKIIIKAKVTRSLTGWHTHIQTRRNSLPTEKVEAFATDRESRDIRHWHPQHPRTIYFPSSQRTLLSTLELCSLPLFSDLSPPLKRCVAFGHQELAEQMTFSCAQERSSRRSKGLAASLGGHSGHRGPY